MLVPSRKVMPSAMSCCWTRSSRRSQTPCFAQRMKSCAASHHGPNSAGMLRHFAPFWCRQKIAEIVRRNSFGGVLPRGRTCSISGSQTAHAASVKISPPLLSAMPQISVQ